MGEPASRRSRQCHRPMDLRFGLAWATLHQGGLAPIPHQGARVDEWKALLAEAHARFLDELTAIKPGFSGLTPFTIAEQASEAKGTFAWVWGASSEIQETINTLNAWGSRLQKWTAWNRVVDSYESEDDKWEVSENFIEPIAFFCMLQPSGYADRLLIVTESILHQANQKVFRGEPDRLDQDALKPGSILRRSDRKKQLNRLGARWSRYPSFRKAWDAMNSENYRKLSRNFRDLSAHSFAPRLLLGHIPRAIRSVGPREELIPQADGSHLLVPHPTKKAVGYVMSQMLPFSLEEARLANLGEYEKARVTMDRFAELVDELCARMNQTDPKTP